MTGCIEKKEANISLRGKSYNANLLQNVLFHCFVCFTDTGGSALIPHRMWSILQICIFSFYCWIILLTKNSIFVMHVCIHSSEHGACERSSASGTIQLEAPCSVNDTSTHICFFFWNSRLKHSDSWKSGFLISSS